MEYVIVNANSIADFILSLQVAKHGKTRGKFKALQNYFRIKL